MGDRNLDSLSAAFYPKACELIARCAARGVMLLVVQTSRTEAEHAANLAAGTSSASRSKHLPRRLRGMPIGPDAGKADAIDLVPYAQFALYGPDKLTYDTADPAFRVIGEEAERIGLRWGGRWQTPHDPGHAELPFPEDQARLIAERARPWPAYRQNPNIREA